MSGALQLGWRNIWRNRRRTFISMSAIGVGLLLVLVYSGLMTGLLGDATRSLDNGGLGHVEAFATDYRPRRDVGRAMRDAVSWRTKVELPGGSEVGTRVLARGLATSARGNEPVQVFGVDFFEERLLSAHLQRLSAGAFPEPADERGVVVGDVLAERLGLKLGSKLRLMVQRADGEMGADLFRVRGVFRSLSPAIAQRQVYVSQAAARSLVGLEGGAHQVVIQLGDPAQADAVAAQLRQALGEGHEVLTWGELLPVLKRFEGLTSSVIYALSFFVYLLVGLGVMNTMLMSVLERTREFGVLMALGTRPRQVISVVLAESFWIATLSVLLGGTLGALLTWYLSVDGISMLGGRAMQLEGATISTIIRSRFDPLDVLRASVFVYLMALVVGLYPATRITRLQPAEALRRS